MSEGRKARSAVFPTVLLLLTTASAASLLISCGVNPSPGHSGGAAPVPPTPAKVTPSISWAQPASITNPTPLSATQLDATANVSGTFSYSPTAGTVLPTGTQTLSTTFTPADTADYNTATASVTITVNGQAPSNPPGKLTPTINWPQPAPITNPTPLNTTQLDATANVPGTFVYSPAAGMVLPGGTQMLTATFTPNDTADYDTATASVTLVVSPAIGSSAHIYVISLPNISGGNPNIPPATYGYAVADDGSLTTIPGFPLPYDFGGLVSGNYLFAGDSDGVHLDTYRINTDGTFTKIASTLDQSATQCQCEVGAAMTDRFGLNLYVVVFDQDNSSWLETYGIDRSTGKLHYLAYSGSMQGPGAGYALEAVSGDDHYIYGDFCSAYGPCEIGYSARNTDGSILGGTGTGGAVKGLTPPPGVMYGMYALQTDPSNHLLAVLSSYDDDKMMPLDVPNRLVTFTIHPDGTLTTTNTAADMTVPADQPMSAMSLSPSGKLLAIAGQNGLQIFDFNGAAPPTPETGVIPTDSITQLLWDNHNHLYGLSYSQKLYVFDVTPAGIVPAPGSPHSVPNALGMFVQP